MNVERTTKFFNLLTGFTILIVIGVIIIVVNVFQNQDRDVKKCNKLDGIYTHSTCFKRDVVFDLNK